MPSNVFLDISPISVGNLDRGASFTPVKYLDVDRFYAGALQTTSGSRYHFRQGLTPANFRIGVRISF